jgi:membrane-associated protease RseP (regulator of RpoE activity)
MKSSLTLHPGYFYLQDYYMLDTQLQQLVYRLSQWIQVIRVGEQNNQILIEGYLLPNASLAIIQHNLRDQLRSIRMVETGEHQMFYLDLKSRRFRIPPLNLLLFGFTILTTVLAGALMEGVNVFQSPLEIIRGIPFSATLMLILGVHELGHFLFARKYHIDATLPYFIPAPTFIGTFGAFIKMRSPVRKRRALVEIGAAGPIAGFLVAVPALFIGLSLSKIVPASTGPGIRLGESLLMKLATAIIKPDLAGDMDIILHPVGFAAWIGMLVTMLNLLPIGQLDGGHIAYALLGKWYQKIAWATLIIILLLSIFSINWLIWAALVFFLIKVKHPPVYDQTPVSRTEWIVGLIALIIFIITFMPVPFSTGSYL